MKQLWSSLTLNGNVVSVSPLLCVLFFSFTSQLATSADCQTRLMPLGIWLIKEIDY